MYSEYTWFSIPLNRYRTFEVWSYTEKIVIFSIYMYSKSDYQDFRFTQVVEFDPIFKVLVYYKLGNPANHAITLYLCPGIAPQMGSRY